MNRLLKLIISIFIFNMMSYPALGHDMNVSQTKFVEQKASMSAAASKPVTAAKSEPVHTLIGPINVSNAYDLNHIAWAVVVFCAVGLSGSPLIIPISVTAWLFTRFCFKNGFKESLIFVLVMKSITCVVGAPIFLFLLPLTINGNVNVIYFVFALVCLLSSLTDSIFVIQKLKKRSEHPNAVTTGSAVLMMLISNLIGVCTVIITLKLLHQL